MVFWALICLAFEAPDLLPVKKSSVMENPLQFEQKDFQEQDAMHSKTGKV